MTDERRIPDPLDARSRAEAARLRAEAAASADTEAALAAVYDPLAPIVGATKRRRPRRLLVGVVAGGAAAALAAVITVATVADRDTTPGPPATDPALTSLPATTARPTPTAPATSTTTTTVSSVSTPLPPGTTTTTTIGPGDPTTVDRLADWPAAPSTLPTLADVPLLLPTAAIPPADSVERSEGTATEPTDWPLYEQEWVIPGDQPLVLTITTKAFLSLDGLQNSTRVALEGWDEAYAPQAGPRRAGVVMREPTGSVSISAVGLTQEEVEHIGATLQRRVDGPGWQLPALATTRLADLVPLTDGWSDAGAGTKVEWFDGNAHVAELTVDAPGYWGTRMVLRDEALHLVDVNGRTAVLSTAGSRVAVSWSPAPGLSALLGYIGTADDALLFVRSLRPVDRATWEAASVPSTFGGDGCHSMFC